jgi:AcrR family transcriptional regulator
VPESVKPRRAYHSPRREQQAAATRRAILDAAARLFDGQGYPATTMEAIAGEAGVSLKTVYLAFATKSGLLRGLWDLQLKGDQNEAGVAERPWYQAVLAEPDARRRIELVSHNSRVVKERISAVLKVIRSAAPVDRDADALWRLIQTDFYDNQRAIVQTVPGLRLDVDRATDILWTLNHPDVWFLLVDERGWTPEQWQRWFADTACAQLLG